MNINGINGIISVYQGVKYENIVGISKTTAAEKGDLFALGMWINIVYRCRLPMCADHKCGIVFGRKSNLSVLLLRHRTQTYNNGEAAIWVRL